MADNVEDLQNPTALRLKAALLLDRAEKALREDDASELRRKAQAFLTRAMRLETSRSAGAQGTRRK
jgi:hypothetical protein